MYGGTGRSSFLAGFVVSTGGSAPLDTVSSIDLALNVSNVLGVPNGGLGLSELAVGALYYANSTTSFTNLSDTIVGNVLLSGGLDTAPAWGKVSLVTHVIDVLPPLYGGTGLNGFDPGGLVYASDASTLATLPAALTGNVLISGGLNTAPLWDKVDLTIHVTGTLSEVNGGTGQWVYTIGDLLYASDTTVLSRLADVAEGSALISGGVGDVPTWGKIGLLTHVSGTLPAESGGTGIGLYIIGDILYASSNSTLSALPDVVVGNVLISGGIATAPSWGKVNLTLHVSGVLSAIGGGSGHDTYVIGDLLVASANDTLSRLADVATGNALISGGIGVVPSWGKIDLTTHVSGTLPATSGGTGQVLYVTGDLLFASDSSTLSRLADVAEGNALISGGIADTPSWGKIGLDTHVSGTLPATAGGTGQGSFAIGDLLYASGTNVLSKLADIATGNALLSGGVGIAPSWGKIDLSSAVAGFLPATSISGTLTADHGGTDHSAYAIGDLLYGASTTSLARLADIATGNALISGGVTTAPLWGKIGLATHVSGTLPATSGGTGQVLYVIGDLLYASSTTALSKLADIATGNALISGGIGAAPSWDKIGLTTHITGILGAGNGGTGIASYAIGDIIYASGSATFTALSDVATGNALISGGLTTAPQWGKIGLTTHVSGTLPATAGGTGQGAYLVGDLLTASTTSALAPINAVATGNALISAGTGTIPAWGKVGLATHTSGTLPANAGGTGQGLYVIGDILAATTTTALSQIQAVATGNALISAGTGTIPSWGKIGLSTHVSGTLPATAGGTGQGLYVIGDILYASSTSALSTLADAATGNALISGGVGAAPSWGKIDLATAVLGTLPATSGGTGQVLYVIGDLLYASSTTALSKLADIATGNALISGGIGAAPSWNKIGLTTHVTGTLGAGNGGTGIASYAIGDILYASGATTLSALSDIATGNALISGGLTTAPSWGKIGLTTHVSGTLPATAGGTGQGLYVIGDILYASSTSALSTLADAATGNALISGGAGAAPSWDKIGLTTHVTGTLGAGNGGTGIASYAVGDIIYASAATTFTKLAAVVTGRALISGGTLTAPSWGQIGLTTHVTGTLPATNGGTGQGSYLVGDLLTASTTSALSAINAIATGNALISAGTGTIPAWGKIGLSTHISGTLPANAGGTGQGLYVVGDILAATTTTALSQIAAAVTGNALISAGTGTIPAWGKIGLSTHTSGTLPANAGGTGQGLYVVGDILAATTTSALSQIAAAATGNALISAGTGTIPAWGKIGLSTHISGTLPANAGGTGQGVYVVGDILGASSTSALSKIQAVATGQALISQGTGTLPAWGQIGLTTHITGTLGAGNGGTGIASYAVGDIIYASASTTFTKLAAVATGNALISGGVTTAPSWGKIALTTHISGTLPVANGGTNIGSYTVGAILYASASGVISQLTDIATGNAIISGGTNTAPSYGKIGLTTHISGTLATANGGTGQTTYTNGQLLIGESSGNSLTKATLTAGSGITVTNGVGSITIAAILNTWIFAEQYANGGANPPNSVSGINRRVLNTVLYNGGSDVTLNTGTNIITVATAGTYYWEATAPGYGCGQHQAAFAASNDSPYAFGTIETAAATVTQTISTVHMQLSPAANDAFVLNHYIQNAVTGGQGVPASAWANTRTYAYLKIHRIA